MKIKWTFSLVTNSFMIYFVKFILNQEFIETSYDQDYKTFIVSPKLFDCSSLLIKENIQYSY